MKNIKVAVKKHVSKPRTIKVAVTKDAPERKTVKASLAVPITLRAVVQRINRKLAADNKVLRAARGDRWWNDLGSYYTVDLRFNAIEDKHVNPEELARELGVLKPYEKIASE